MNNVAQLRHETMDSLTNRATSFALIYSSCWLLLFFTGDRH